MSTLSPYDLREHAAAILLDHARDVEWTSIRKHLTDADEDADDSAAVAEIMELISKATVTVEWPEIAIEQTGGGR